MSRKEKAIERLLQIPKNYTYTEAKTLVGWFGYQEYNKGKTSGSRVKFFRQRDKKVILLHKPHPGDIMKEYSIKDLIEHLRNNGDL